MSLAVYVHIPYCLQRCRYCDFTTFEFSEILPPEEYVKWVLREIRLRRPLWKQTEIQTLYFGGGTPSLISPEHIVAIKNELANSGFSYQQGAEITIEINPATLDEAKIEYYAKHGVNRFSVGAQTFNDRLLKVCGRKHSAIDTHATLKLLARNNFNYSFDLLFALPGQTLEELREDLAIVADYAPPHLSAYCLTVPEGHPMSGGRAPENEQLEMFAEIEERLARVDLRKYEISNFAKPGFESRHNSVYWNDQSYWGLGLSSHSYDRDLGPFGTRFWNPKSLKIYDSQTQTLAESWQESLKEDQIESLALHESLTDFCHMHLRTMAGLPQDALRKKYPSAAAEAAISRLKRLGERQLVQCVSGVWQLTSQGQLISNKVFEELCFLASELRLETLTCAGPDSYCAV